MSTFEMHYCDVCGKAVGEMEIVTVHIQLPFHGDTDAGSHFEHPSGSLFGDGGSRLVVLFGNDQSMSEVDG